MSRQIIQTTVLDNGITVVTDSMPSAHSTALGVWLPRGSRHEGADESGASHFYEHLVFKGTKNRSAFEIASSLEDRGGMLEAYTTRQETGFYAQVVPSDAGLALEVISDMLMHPLFDKKDFEKERKVIIEEIRSYEDIAEECVGDLFYATHYEGTGLARPIAGTAKTVRALTIDDLLRYREQVISEIPLVVCATGKIDHGKFVEQCLRHFGEKKKGSKNLPTAYKATSAEKYSFKPDLQQSNFVWGTSFPFEQVDEKFRYALSLFNVAFGGGMSSRLFQKIREEHGLAYSVYSTIDVFNDNYGFSVSMATDPNRLAKAAGLMKNEFERFLESGFVASELERTRHNILGSMAIGADNTEKRLLRLAEHTLHFGECVTMDEMKKGILNITEQEVVQSLRAAFENADFAAAVVAPKGSPKLKFL